MIVRDITERSVWSPLTNVTQSHTLFTILLSVTTGSSKELLEKAIRSVLGQRVSELELIVIDDSQSSEVRELLDEVTDRDFTRSLCPSSSAS